MICSQIRQRSLYWRKSQMHVNDTIFIWIHFKCTFLNGQQRTLHYDLLCCVFQYCGYLVDQFRVLQYLCLVIYDPQAIRRHPEHRSHGLLTRLWGHTQHTQWETDGKRHKKRVDFPISSPCRGPSPSSTFTQMHFHYQHLKQEKS